MEKIELERREYWWLPMSQYAGPNSLDAIASKAYGREYSGLQVMEHACNDTCLIWPMFNSDVEEELGGDVQGAELANWLSLRVGGPLTSVRFGEVVEDGTWGPVGLETDGTVKFGVEIVRAAPDPRWVLADLIRKGTLPYGLYLVSVSW